MNVSYIYVSTRETMGAKNSMKSHMKIHTLKINDVLYCFIFKSGGGGMLKSHYRATERNAKDVLDLTNSCYLVLVYCTEI